MMTFNLKYHDGIFLSVMKLFKFVIVIGCNLKIFDIVLVIIHDS